MRPRWRRATSAGSAMSSIASDICAPQMPRKRRPCCDLTQRSLQKAASASLRYHFAYLLSPTRYRV
jgi:hypothetical protein